MADNQKVDLKSLNLTDDKLEKLKEIFPETVTEGKIDFEKLKLTLGDKIEVGKERYGMNWPGKADCFKTIQTPSIATLKPDKEKSVDFDITENLFIEGDNLEVLKLLQKSYYGKVKMIYIDPPYNTGNDFVYPDDYSESLDTYLSYSGQKNEEGKKFSTNAETDGRFHSKWINMMYPRLFLAKNLLKDDGIIFISIDDYEMSNLRKIMDEIFGEENSLTESPTSLIWSRSGSTAGHFANAHEYILVYAKDKKNTPLFKLEDYGDNDIIKHGALKKISKANPASEIEFPVGFQYEGDTATFKGEIGGSEIQIINDEMIFENGKLVKAVKITAGWGMRDQILNWIDGDETYDSKGQKIIKFFFNKQGILTYEKERGTIHPKTILPKDVGTTKTGSDELKSIFDGVKVMDYPKPSTLIKYLASFTTHNDDIVLDFFAGSATTAQAIIELNIEEKTNRKFIMTQLPEPTKDTSDAFNAGYKTITQVGEERIRRVIKKIKEEKNNALDLGFKVFKLESSNFKIWDGAQKENVAEQLEAFVNHINPKSSQDDILYELILKSGFSLTAKIETLELASKKVYSISEGALYICLEKEITKEVLQEIANKKPIKFICLDEGFQDNDQLKTNAVEIMKAKDVEFRTV